MRRYATARFFPLMCVLVLIATSAVCQQKSAEDSLSDRVEAFLHDQESRWHDMNIPAKDGQFLHDLIVEHKYTQALEIGTSTGHSGIWIAWALSKTGGKLITIEIDEDRYREALRNFEQAGLSKYIDARLADAHELVKQLKGPFDFVFSDADKNWNTQYFIDLAPKMVAGGCYTTHNISKRWGEFRGDTREYVDYLNSRSDFETTVENTRSSGIAVSFKRLP